MTEPTGAEKYLDERLSDPEYREAYAAEKERINLTAAEMSPPVPFEKDAVLGYIDLMITNWRIADRAGDPHAAYYVDAYQCMRMSLFGELVPPDEP